MNKEIKDYWGLYSELVEIHWKNGEAIEVAVRGKIFKATKKKKRKTPTKPKQ